jgi:hypothetical protein
MGYFWVMLLTLLLDQHYAPTDSMMHIVLGVNLVLLAVGLRGIYMMLEEPSVRTRVGAGMLIGAAALILLIWGCLLSMF